jgi:outer membrane immunogenic protein
MKRLATLLAFSTVLSFGAAAQAADMVEAPLVYDWTGFYIGANVGYAFGGSDRVGIQEHFHGGPSDAFQGGEVGDLNLSGVFGGPQIGYNIQAGAVVFGIEGDFEFSGIDDSDNGKAENPVGLVLDASSSDDVDWFATVRGRLGYAFDNLLLYGTGGLAVGHFDYEVNGKFSDEFNFKIHDDFTKVGWTAGGGLEWGFDENWSAKVEYKYVNFGKKSLTATLLDPAGDPTDYTETTHATPDFHTIKFGVNYRF